MRVFPWVLAVMALMAVTIAYAGPRAVSASRLVRPGDPILGNPHGRLTIVDFYDTACGPCRLLNHRIDRLIRHDPDIRYVPIDVPILGHRSVIAAKALIAAERQGRRRSMFDLLMAQNRMPSDALMRADADALGLDPAWFARDLASAATARIVAAQLRLGRALRVNYVPVVYIGRYRIPGAMSYRDLRRLVSQAEQPRISETREGFAHS